MRSLHACSASDELLLVSRRARTLQSLKSPMTTPGGQAGLVCCRPRALLIEMWPPLSWSPASLSFQQVFLLRPGLQPQDKPRQEHTPSRALLTCVLREPSRNAGNHWLSNSHPAMIRVT